MSQQQAQRNREFREKARLERETLKANLANQYGVTGNQKEQCLFELAWAFGHANGLREVEFYYGEMVDLIKESV